MPPTTKRPQLRRVPAIVLNVSVVVACALWAATGFLLLLLPGEDVWKWTAVASVVALLAAGAAVAFGQKRPTP